MKKLSIILLLVSALFLSGCSPKITSGKVYDKEHKDAFVTVAVYPVVTSNRKTTTTMMIPHTVYFPERWIVYVESFENGEKITEDFYVSESVYNSINIGDMFEYDEKRGDLEEEPYRKERADV